MRRGSAFYWFETTPSSQIARIRPQIRQYGLALVFASYEPRRMEAVFGGGFARCERVCEPRLSYPVVITFRFLTRSVSPAPFVKPERTPTLLGCTYICHVDNVARILATCVNWRHCWVCSQCRVAAARVPSPHPPPGGRGDRPATRGPAGATSNTTVRRVGAVTATGPAAEQGQSRQGDGAGAAPIRAAGDPPARAFLLSSFPDPVHYTTFERDLRRKIGSEKAQSKLELFSNNLK